MGEVIVGLTLTWIVNREDRGSVRSALDVAVELAEDAEALGGGDRLAFVGP
jgi:hypothetical protein